MMKALPILAAAFLAAGRGAASAQTPPSPTRPGPAAAPSQPVPQALAEVDRYLGLARQLMAEMERLYSAPPPQAAAAAPPPCMAATSFDSIVHGNWTYMNLPLVYNLINYYGCLATVAGSESQCDPLKAVSARPMSGGPSELYDMCRKNYLRFRMSRDMITRSPSLGDTIRLNVTRPGHSDSDVDRLVRQVSRFPLEPGKACAGIGQYFGPPPYDCTSFLGIQAGRFDCSKLPDRVEEHIRIEKFICQEAAAFRKAYEAKSAQACGAHAQCQVMMGAGAAACRPLGELAKKSFCEPIGEKPPVDTSPKPAPPGPLPIPAQKQEALESWLGKAHFILFQLDQSGASDSAATAREIDAREERIAEIRLQFDQLKMKNMGSKPAAPAAGGGTAVAPPKAKKK